MRNLLLLMLPVASWATYDWTCNLHCFNDGICQHGKGKFGSYAGIEDEDEMPWEKNQHISGMYCACPKGFTGLQCEIKLVVCGEDGTDTHTCFNGSECRKERASNGEIFYRCECDASQSRLDSTYAGRYCEHIATTFCDHPGTDGSFGQSSSFCTNGGSCKPIESSDSKHHFGCECPPEWTGGHCEIPADSGYSVESIVQAATDEKNIAKIILIILFVTFSILGCCYWNDKRVMKKRKESERQRRMMGMDGGSYARRRERDLERQRSGRSASGGFMA